MTVSTHYDNRLERIAQLEQEIKDKKAERNRVRAEEIVALRNQGYSLRAIAEKVGLSHGMVNHELQLHAARNEGQVAA